MTLRIALVWWEENEPQPVATNPTLGSREMGRMEVLLERMMNDPRLEKVALHAIYSARQAAGASAASVFALGLRLDFTTIPGLGWDGEEIDSLVQWKARAVEALTELTDEYANSQNQRLFILMVAHRNAVTGLLAEAHDIHPSDDKEGNRTMRSMRETLSLVEEGYLILTLELETWKLNELPLIRASTRPMVSS